MERIFGRRSVYMNPELVSKVQRTTGSLYESLYLSYVLLSDRKSWRFLPAWFRSIGGTHSPLKDGIPWLPFEAINWLQSYLRFDMKVFEYGSGGSTVFFGERVSRVFTVEHDKEWHSLVAANLEKRKLTNCSYVLCEPTAIDRARGVTDGVVYDRFTEAEREKYQGLDFGPYVRTIDIHTDRSFDLVLVDGRARAGCLGRALGKIRPGGYLMLDNSNDSRFVECLDMAKRYSRTDFYGIAPFWPPRRWRTSIWKCVDL